MSIAYKSFGACYPYAGVGVLNVLMALGNAARGGTIEERFEHEGRAMDGAGKVPADYQAMGSEAIITMDLGAWDDSIMDIVIARSQASGAIGAFLAAGGYAFALYLPSSTDRPYYFPCCVLVNPKRNPGTKSDDMSVQFKAWRPLPPTGTNTASIPLYTRVAP